MKIVLTGGGTGGHVTPNLALIPVLRQRGFQISYIGEYEGPEKELTKEFDYVDYHGISSGKLRRYFDVKNLTDPARVIKGYAESLSLLKKLSPDIVFSKGGFVSVPVVYAARTLGIPVVSHESDITPGLANKLSVPCVKKICCTFERAAQLLGEKGVYTGTPIRPEILRGNRERGVEKFGLTNGRPIIMVTGGSSGAQSINDAVRDSLDQLIENFQILHLCGKGNQYGGYMGIPGYAQMEYLDTQDMADAYACADIVVSRAGANTLSELIALHKATLLIPYPMGASRGDQVQNAREFDRKGLAQILMQDEMTSDRFVGAILQLYRNRTEYEDRMLKEPAADGLTNVLNVILDNCPKAKK